MPILETRGNACAMAFGFLTGQPPEPPGSYSFPNNFQGLSYQPVGWANVTVEVNGAGGFAASNPYGWPTGSKAERTGTPVADLYISTPSSSQYQPNSNGGNGGSGGSVSRYPYRGEKGGAAGVAYWNGGADALVAAGGGGASFTMNSSSRRGKIEGDSSGNCPNGGSGNNGGSGSGGSCYYGGGGGGGGYSTGGNGGSINNGGRAGGNGTGPDPAGSGSYGYTSVTVGSHNVLTYDASITWG
jgi:hypothetical protein